MHLSTGYCYYYALIGYCYYYAPVKGVLLAKGFPVLPEEAEVFHQPG